MTARCASAFQRTWRFDGCGISQGQHVFLIRFSADELRSSLYRCNTLADCVTPVPITPITEHQNPPAH